MSHSFYKKGIVKLKQIWPWLSYLVIFSIAFIIFLHILVPPGILCPDSFYHTKMALLIKEGGLIQDFPWTQFTTYKDLFVDHHFAYHWLLIPFLGLPTPENLDKFSMETEPLIKAKLATAFFAALALLAIYWFLRKLKVKGPFIWTLLGLLIGSFLTRLSLIRAPGLSVAILILGLYFILSKKYLALFILSFLYVWIYGAWPLILLAVLIYCLADAIKKLIDYWPMLQIKSESMEYKKRVRYLLRGLCYFFTKNNIKLLSACVSGLTVGLIVNPYFPKTLPFYWFQTVKIAIFNYRNQIGMGIEWYPPELGAFYINFLPILIPLVISLAWFAVSIRRQKTRTWFLLLLSIFFFFYTLKSRRNVEYLVGPALFFSAVIFTQIGRNLNRDRIKNQIKQLVRGPENIFYFLIAVFSMTLAGFFLIFYLNHSIGGTRQSYARSRPLNHLQMASRWLKENAAPGEIIFQSNWDIFPESFYFNSQNYYINGLDQTFMYEKSPDLYQAWDKLVSGETDPRETARILKEKFNASYVLLSKEDKKLGKLLKRSKSLEKTFEDEQAIVYKVNLGE